MNNSHETLAIENARLTFRNFAGKETKFNKNGTRSFAVLLDWDLAYQLSEDGWNVKFPKENPDIPQEEDSRRPYLSVTFSYDKFPPHIVMLHNGVPTKVDASNAEELDWVRIDSADIELRPHRWSVNGNSGIKAYLEALYINVRTDAFYHKYGNLNG